MNESSDNSHTNDFSVDSQPQSAREDIKTLTTASKIDHVKYDLDEIARFIDTVFPHKQEDEHILTTCEFKAYPHSPKRLLETLHGVSGGKKLGKPLFYAISTVTPTERHLRNLRTAFKRLHVVVLDDIGTKIPKERIPLAPSYIVESSQGNFQYGYVLSQPLSDITAASALITQLAAQGYSDEGGCMVNKYVRLPQGIHGKESSININFRTRLVDLNTQQFSVDTLCEAFNLGFSGADLHAQPTRYLTQTQQLTHLYADRPAKHYTMDGVCDPLLEILSEEGRVFTENGDWVTIECPWHEQHETGDDYAYYSPLGRGYGDFKARRSFKCFHGKCRDIHRTREFLEWFAEVHDVDLPLFDPCPDMLGNYIYDAKNDTVWNMRGSFPEPTVNMKAFTNAHLKKHAVPSTKNAKMAVRWCYMTEAQIWLHHPQRVTVFGSVSDPTTRDRIVTHDNHQRLNTFCYPNFRRIPPDEKRFAIFTEFLEYLIPNTFERDIFLDMLSAKLRDMSFRGWGIFMATPSYGTGRGTLCLIIEKLFLRRNCVSKDFDELLSNPDFNEHLKKAIVYTPEIEQQYKSSRSRYQIYNNLKSIVDTTEKQIEVNNKYGMKEDVVTCSMFIFMSNHEVAALIPRKDRRLFMIENPSHLKEPEFYTRLRREFLNRMTEVLDDGYTLRDHVLSWLWNRDPDVAFLNGNAPMTQLKSVMVTDGMSTMEKALDYCYRNFPSSIIPMPVMQDLFNDMHVMEALGLEQQRGNNANFIRRITAETTVSCDRNVRWAIPAISAQRCRLCICRDQVDAHPLETENLHRALITPDPTLKEKALRAEAQQHVREVWTDFNKNEFVRGLIEYLHSEGCINKPAGFAMGSNIASIKKSGI